MTKISILMSVHNGMPYLEEAILSVRKQTFRNYEFIIVDDGSNDGTYAYLKKVKDKRIRIFKNKKNLGLAASLNKAFKLSKGEYIARMDADDVCATNRLEAQYKFLLNNPKIYICGTWAKLIDEKGKIIAKVTKPTQDKEIKKMNSKVTGIIHPTWLLKRELFLSLKGYDETADMVEDFDFLIRAKNYGMANISKYLLYWRSIKSRRSYSSISNIYRKSFFLKLKYFKKGEFGLSYLPYIIRSFVTTFLIPASFKLYLNKKLGLL